MKKLIIAMTVVMGVSAVVAGPRTKKAAALVAEDESTSGRAAKILIEQEPKLGSQTCLGAPGIGGASLIGQCYKKPRSWIVLESKYKTFGSDGSDGKAPSRFLDQLTFTWHVLLETKSARENKGNREGLAPYSYFTTSVTYFNIPEGSHASSVVLPPSYLERYGEPKVVGLEITNEKGEELNGDCWSEVKGIPSHEKFWENQQIMNAQGNDGNPMIERRQGLVDRSKTIWALVNSNDYEATVQ